MSRDPYYEDISLPMDLDVGYHISGEADHNLLYNRDKDNQHPISAITGLEGRLEDIEAGGRIPVGGRKDQVLTKNSDEDYDLVWKDSQGGGQHDRTGYYDEIERLGSYKYVTYYHVLDYKYAYEYFESTKDTFKPCGCSSVRNGNYYGRSFDWYYSHDAEFVVSVPRIANRFASVGISPGFHELSDEFVKSGKYNDYYRLLPFNIVDGINEHGLVCNTNVVPTDYGRSSVVPMKESKITINGMMLPRYILDHFKTAKEAAEFIKDHATVYFSQDIHEHNYELHLMIADPAETYVVEFVGKRTIIKKHNKMTNFYIDKVRFNEDGTVYTPGTQDYEHDAITTNNITKNGSGLERYNLIVNNYSSANTAEGMRELLNQLTYTRAYKSSHNPSNPYWYTEFVGVDDLNVASEPDEYTYVVDTADSFYRKRERGDGRTWQSVHQTVFDIAARTMSVRFQESEQIEVFKVLSSSDLIDVDNKSIVFNADDKLAISGFESATVGQLASKGESSVVWVDPDRALTQEEIEEILKAEMEALN